MYQNGYRWSRFAHAYYPASPEAKQKKAEFTKLLERKFGKQETPTRKTPSVTNPIFENKTEKSSVENSSENIENKIINEEISKTEILYPGFYNELVESDKDKRNEQGVLKEYIENQKRLLNEIGFEFSLEYSTNENKSFLSKDKK